MKPYTNLNGKAKWFLFWGDTVQSKFKKIFKKSARRQKLIEINAGLMDHETRYAESHEDFLETIK